MLRALARHLFVPGLLAVSACSWAYHPAAARWLEEKRWGIDFTTAALLASIALIWVAEQVIPARPDWNYNVAAAPAVGIRRFAHDLIYLTFVTLLNGLTTTWTSMRLAGWVGRGGYGLDRAGAVWPAHAPFALRVVLTFLIVELFSYGYHRVAHQVDFLWRFHATHHLITEVTGLKALRTHPIDNALFYLPRTLPLMLLGAGTEELVAATYFGCILGVLSHANIDVSERWLGWVINFPRYHVVHHSADLGESRSNFGCHTVLWDRVFGTFRLARGEVAIGVEPVGPRTLLQELVGPFYRERM